MRIQQEERLVLLFQVFDKPHQDDVLENVSEIPSVVNMAIIHNPLFSIQFYL